MNIHEPGNAIVYGSDITALFNVVGQTIKLKQCLFSYGMKSLYGMWRVKERGKKDRQTERNCAIYHYWRHAVLSPHIKIRFFVSASSSCGG